jgi:hypothetical protein
VDVGLDPDYALAEHTRALTGPHSSRRQHRPSTEFRGLGEHRQQRDDARGGVRTPSAYLPGPCHLPRTNLLCLSLCHRIQRGASPGGELCLWTAWPRRAAHLTTCATRRSRVSVSERTDCSNAVPYAGITGRRRRLRIEDYGLIGDLQAAALVGRDGAVDWLCLPRFDSPSSLSALLGDEKHGRWRLAPAGECAPVRAATDPARFGNFPPGVQPPHPHRGGDGDIRSGGGGRSRVRARLTRVTAGESGD